MHGQNQTQNLYLPLALSIVVCGCTPTSTGIRAGLHVPPWLLVQFQERGSYRTEDVVDFLDWALEPAACPQQSTVVLLGWFSAHLSAEVAALVARKGHILLLHGGGVTGIEQINAAWLALVPFVRGGGGGDDGLDIGEEMVGVWEGGHASVVCLHWCLLSRTTS